LVTGKKGIARSPETHERSESKPSFYAIVTSSAAKRSREISYSYAPVSMTDVSIPLDMTRRELLALRQGSGRALPTISADDLSPTTTRPRDYGQPGISLSICVFVGNFFANIRRRWIASSGL
jgi:hypothetical protein